MKLFINFIIGNRNNSYQNIILDLVNVIELEQYKIRDSAIMKLFKYIEISHKDRICYVKRFPFLDSYNDKVVNKLMQLEKIESILDEYELYIAPYRKQIITNLVCLLGRERSLRGAIYDIFDSNINSVFLNLINSFYTTWNKLNGRLGFIKYRGEYINGKKKRRHYYKKGAKKNV